MRNRDQSLVAVVYYHASYLFIYNFSYVVKMSDHDSVLITVFWWCLRAINDFFTIGFVFWFPFFMVAAILDNVDRPHLSKL